jgi:hypothetical protein
VSKLFKDGFQKKARAKGEGKPAMAQAHKIIINSGYGFWGLRTTEDRGGVETRAPDSSSYVECLSTERLVSARGHDNGTLFYRVLKT